MRPPQADIPPHWIGVWKGYEHLCPSLSEALVELTPEDLSTHALVLGATGSGKTNLLHHLIAGDIQRGHSFVVLDARGDLALSAIELLAWFRTDPGKIAFLDLREKTSPLGFNPLSGSGEPYFRALGLIDAAQSLSESWGVQLAETLRNALLVLAEAGASLLELGGLLHDPGLRRTLLAKAASQPLKDFWERYGGLSPDKQAALASPVLNKLSALLSTEGLRRVLGHPEPIDLGRCLDAPGSVLLVSLAVDELHSAGWMTGSILLSSICRTVFARATVSEASRNPVRLYVDEFEHFASDSFEAVLSEGRRFKLSLVLAHQTLSQLTPRLRSLVLGNVGVKVVFRSSQADAELLSKDLSGSKSLFDIARLPVGEAILWKRGDNPWPIEVNTPILDHTPGLSPAALRLLARLAELRPPYRESVLPGLDPPEDGPEEQDERPRSPRPSPSLEDWLS